MEADRVVGGRYRLRGRIGSGGMGTVWRAYDEVLHRDVAIKQIALGPLLDPDERSTVLARAMAEARSAARLNHPNIVGVHDVLPEGDEVWIVMTLIDGASLQQVVDGAGVLSPVAAARIGLGLLDALDAAHLAGVVHRDVKPSNVLLPAAGGVRLTDFSIATAVDVAGLTRSGVVLGTPGYVAPERLTTGRSGPAVDLFGLGATLFFAVEGRAPFDREASVATLFATVNEPHPPMLHAGPLAGVIDGLLIKDPQTRWTSQRCRPALQAVAAGTGAPVPPTAPAIRTRTPAGPAASGAQTMRDEARPAPAGRSARSRRVRVTIAVLVVLALAIGGTMLALANAGRSRAGAGHPTGTPGPTISSGSPGPTVISESPSTPPSRPVLAAARVDTKHYGLAGDVAFWDTPSRRWHFFHDARTGSSGPERLVQDYAPRLPTNTFYGDITLYTVDRPRTIWPLWMVWARSTYHLYFIVSPNDQSVTGPLYLATSPDLTRWQVRGPIMSDPIDLNQGFAVAGYANQWYAFSGDTVRQSGDLVHWSAPRPGPAGAESVCGITTYKGAYYLCVQSTDDHRYHLLRTADLTDFTTAADIPIIVGPVASGWDARVGAIGIDRTGQPYVFGVSGWYATISGLG